MRVLKGGVAHIAEAIEEDLRDRETSLYKAHISGLADLAACALSCRNVNTAEWMAVLPRKSDEKSKERYISRWLSNALIDPLDVMEGYIPEIMELLASNGKTACSKMKCNTVDCFVNSKTFKGVAIERVQTIKL